MHTLTSGCSGCTRTESWQHMKWVIRVAFSHRSPPIRLTSRSHRLLHLLCCNTEMFCKTCPISVAKVPVDLSPRFFIAASAPVCLASCLTGSGKLPTLGVLSRYLFARHKAVIDAFLASFFAGWRPCLVGHRAHTCASNVFTVHRTAGLEAETTSYWTRYGIWKKNEEHT